MIAESKSLAHQEKKHAALASLFWAFFLTVIKLVAGLATNSLGILSEALHSGLDLVAAGITFVAVRVASRPADKTHPYGYGKIENLSALAETVLLLVTCGWIIREAVERLFFHVPQVSPSWWGMGIILISLLVDINRASMLRRVAKKHNSQALEADALHFSTDIWSSAVVLIGLLCVQASQWIPSDHILVTPLRMADAIAALMVSGIVILVGIRLSRRAVSTLLDGGGKEHTEALEQALAQKMPHNTVRRLRIRESGADVFMDITVDAPATLRLDAAHDVSRRVEDIAHEIVPSADITVHVEPCMEAPDSVLDLVRTVAAAHNLSIHNLVLSMQSEGLLIFLHVEAPPDLPLSQAHLRVHDFEQMIGKRLNAAHIVTHIEPETRQPTGDGTAPLISLADARQVLEAILPDFPTVSNIHDVQILHMGGAPLLSFHCLVSGDPSVAKAHDIASALEYQLRTRIPFLERILVHTDPA